MDIIFINNLEIETIIGIYQEEKQNKQPLILNIEIQFDFHTAIKSDNIKDTIDYDHIVKLIKNFSKEHKYELIESFAHYCCQLIIKKFDLQWIKMTIFKPHAALNAKATGVTIVRTKSDFKFADSK